MKCNNLRDVASNEISIIAIRSYNFALRDIVEEDEVAEHGDEAEESETSDNVDHNIFQIKLSFNISFLFDIGLLFQQKTCSALYDDDKLDPIGLLEILL